MNSTIVALDKIGRKVEISSQVAFANSNIYGESFLVLAKVKDIREGQSRPGAVLVLEVEGSSAEYTERSEAVILT